MHLLAWAQCDGSAAGWAAEELLLLLGQKEQLLPQREGSAPPGATSPGDHAAMRLLKQPGKPLLTF